MLGSFCHNRNIRSDIDYSDIVAPVPRRHLTLQRSESQHWLGSPPLSPVSVVSRTLSPISHVPLSPTHARKRYSSIFSAISEFEKPHLTAASSSQFISAANQKTTEDIGMARRWTRWMHKQGLKHRVLPLIVLFTALVKWGITLGSYSGVFARAVRVYVQLTFYFYFYLPRTRYSATFW